MWEWPRDKLTHPRSSYLPPAPPLPAKHSINCQRETCLFVLDLGTIVVLPSLIQQVKSVLTVEPFLPYISKKKMSPTIFPYHLGLNFPQLKGPSDSHLPSGQSFFLIFFESRSLFTNFPAHCAIWIISAPSRFSVDCVHCTVFRCRAWRVGLVF